MAEESSTRITLKELYIQVQKIQSMLEKLTAQLPSISDKLDELEQDVTVKLNDHEARLRKLEMRMWQGLGILSFLFAVVPLFLGFMN